MSSIVASYDPRRKCLEELSSQGNERTRSTISGGSSRELGYLISPTGGSISTRMRPCDGVGPEHAYRALHPDQ